MHEHASKMELGDKETSYMHSSKHDMLSARNTSLYAYGTYHTRMVIPYAYDIQKYTTLTPQIKGKSQCINLISHT